MRTTRLACAIIGLAICSPASATLIGYSFAGLPYDWDGNPVPEFSGGFTLDAAVPWDIRYRSVGGGYSVAIDSSSQGL